MRVHDVNRLYLAATETGNDQAGTAVDLFCLKHKFIQNRNWTAEVSHNRRQTFEIAIHFVVTSGITLKFLKL